MIREGEEIRIGRNGYGASTARLTTIREWRGDLCLVTCGHVFTNGRNQVILDGHVIAELSENLLEAPVARDVAFARLTDAGLDAVGSFIPRATGKPGAEARLIRLGKSSLVTAVMVTGDTFVYLPSGGPFIRTRYLGEAEGDSGAPLVTQSDSGLLSGLLTGYSQLGNDWYAFYTPLDDLF